MAKVMRRCSVGSIGLGSLRLTDAIGARDQSRHCCFACRNAIDRETRYERLSCSSPDAEAPAAYRIRRRPQVDGSRWNADCRGPPTLSLLPLLRPTIFLLAPVLEQILVECFETVSEAQDLKPVAITDGPDF